MQERSYYNVYSDYLKKKYGEKVYKLPINLNITCPNRINGKGCTFCADVGTGFEAMSNQYSVTEQLETTKEKIKKKYKANKFIAYFQNYTNTYMPLDEFKGYMLEAAKAADIVEISISTRPDCINDSYLIYLKEISERYSIHINLELGLQTVNYHTLKAIHRGHGLAEFVDAVLRVHSYGFTICTHMILNLPNDTMLDVMEGAKLLSALPIDIIKLHSLYIPKNTELYTDYKNGKITICSKDEYMERLVEFISLLRPDIVIERLFSRIPEEYAVFSNWNTSWWKLKEEFKQRMDEKQYAQGIFCDYLNGAAFRERRIT